MTDAAHCGACGNACAVDQACVEGACRCQDGLALCGGACVDLGDDDRHCGRCGMTCDADERCVEGLCRINPAP
jgi:hypothetical protein